MEGSIFLKPITAILGMIDGKRKRKEISNEIDYRTTLAPNVELIDSYITAITTAQGHLDIIHIFDMGKYAEINIAKRALVSAIINSESKFKFLKEYSQLIDDYKKNSQIKNTKEILNIEDQLILAYAQHLLEVQKFIEHYLEDDKVKLIHNLELIEKKLDAKNDALE